MNEKDQKEVRRYMLDEMTMPEQEAFEARYFADEELLNELEMARAELLDDWAHGELPEAEQESLTRQLRQLPALRARGACAQRLQQVFSQADNGLPASPARPAQSQRAKAGSPWFTGLLGLLHVSPWTFAASFVLLAAALWWWLNPRADSAPVAPAVAQVSPANSPAQAAAPAPPDKTVGPAAQITATGNKPRRSPAVLTTSVSGAVASFVLSAELVRSGAEPSVLTLPAGTRTLRLQLELVELPTRPLRAELHTVAGELMWQQAGLRAQKLQKLCLVVCEIPVAQVEDGVYRLRLFRADQALETEYLFRSQKL